MKRKALCLLLIIALVIILPVAASAENGGSDGQTVDWNSVDWDTYDWNQLYNGSEAMSSLEKWLETEASFSKFCEYGSYADGWRAIIFRESANRRFIADPEGFLIDLAKTDEKTQSYFIQDGLFPASAVSRPESTVSAIEGIYLTQTEHPEAVALLQELIESAKEKLKVSITTPHTTSWEDMDWETFSWKEFPTNGEAYKRLLKWLRDGASNSVLFACTRTADGAIATALTDIFNQRFIGRPESFLIDLAKEDEVVQNRIIGNLMFDVVVEFDLDAATAAIEGIRLDQSKHPEAVELMLELIQKIEKKYSVSITVPKTGDPVLVAVAAWLLSGSGLAMLLKKKKA